MAEMEQSHPKTELRAVNLHAQRGDKILFAKLSFTAKSGQMISLSGVNGAGKTTLLRIIAGLCPPLEGSAFLTEARLTEAGLTEAGGRAPFPQKLPLALFSHYLSEKNAMKPQLSVWQNLHFWHCFFHGGRGRAQTEKALFQALLSVKMEAYAELPFAVLSTGQKRRIGLCRLTLAPRPLWLLDEPTSGLDNAGHLLFAELCRQHMRQNGLIIAATHLPLAAAAFSLSLADYQPKTRREQFYDPLSPHKLSDKTHESKAHGSLAAKANAPLAAGAPAAEAQP